MIRYFGFILIIALIIASIVVLIMRAYKNRLKYFFNKTIIKSDIDDMITEKKIDTLKKQKENVKKTLNKR